MDSSIINSPFPHHSEPPFVSPFVTPRTLSRLRNPTTLTTTSTESTPTRVTRGHSAARTTTPSIIGQHRISTPSPTRNTSRLSTLPQLTQAASSPHYAQETISSAAKRRYREEGDEEMDEGIQERIAVLEAEIRMLREQRGWIAGMIEGQKKGGGTISSGEKDRGEGGDNGDNDDNNVGDGVVREEGKGGGE